jgi:hypothetical protein
LRLGVREAKHEWIARYDADDRYSFNRLQEQKLLLNDGVAAVFSDYEFYSIIGKSLGTIPSAVFAPCVSVSLVSGQRTAHSSVIFNKKIAEEVGSYRESDFLAEDLSLWLRMSRLGKLLSVPKTHLRYLIHGKSISANKRREMIFMRRKLLNSIGINSPDLRELLDNHELFFSSYDGMEWEFSRKILLMRELKLAASLLRVSSLRQLSSLAPNLITNPEARKDLFKLIREREMRKKERRL